MKQPKASSHETAFPMQKQHCFGPGGRVQNVNLRAPNEGIRFLTQEVGLHPMSLLSPCCERLWGAGGRGAAQHNGGQQPGPSCPQQDSWPSSPLSSVPQARAGRRRRQLLRRSCHLLAAPSNMLQKRFSSEWGWPVERRKMRSVVRADASHRCYQASKAQVSCLSTTDGAAQRLLLRSRRKSPKESRERPPDPVAPDALSVLTGKPLPGLRAGSSATTPSSQRRPSSEAGMSNAGPAW